jgi:hypothetical protein
MHPHLKALVGRIVRVLMFAINVGIELNGPFTRNDCPWSPGENLNVEPE